MLYFLTCTLTTENQHCSIAYIIWFVWQPAHHTNKIIIYGSICLLSLAHPLHVQYYSPRGPHMYNPWVQPLLPHIQSPGVAPPPTCIANPWVQPLAPL